MGVRAFRNAIEAARRERSRHPRRRTSSARSAES
jgi:hypothetical protein